MKKTLLILLILSFVFVYISCVTEQTSNTKTVQNQTKSSDNQNTQKQEIDGTLFENAPAKIDLVELKKELSDVFNLYEQTILSKDYDKWMTMITDKFKEKFSNKEYLKKIGASAYGVTNLEDYFYNVMYRARIELNRGKPLKFTRAVFKLGDVSKVIIYAFSEYEKRTLMYFFIKVSNTWKIGIDADYE